MKRDLIFLPLWLLMIPFFLFLHVAIIIFLPYPFSHINVLAIAVVMAILIREKGSVLWWVFCLFYILDWYTVGPFGLVLSAAVLGTLVLLWLYRGILSNRGFWSAAILLVIFLISFRIPSVGFLLMKTGYTSELMALLFQSLVVEIFITAPFVSFCYLLLAQCVPSLKVTHARHTNLYAKN